MAKYIPCEHVYRDTDGTDVCIIRNKEDFFEIMKNSGKGYVACKQIYVDGIMTSGYIKSGSLTVYYLRPDMEDIDNEEE